MGWFDKLDTAFGGYLPGGADPDDVTWRDAVGTIGDAVAKVAPALSFVPGVGWVAAGAAGLAGGLAGELNDADGFQPLKALKSGAWGAAGGYGVDKLQGLSALGGAAGGAGGGSGVAGTAAEGGGFLGGLKRLGSGALNAAGAVGDFAGEHSDLLPLALGGASAIQGARQSKRASDLQDKALDYASGRDQEAKRYRDMAFSRLSAMDLGEKPNVTGLLFDPGNPYARRAA